LIVLSLFLTLIGTAPYFDFDFIGGAIIQLAIALIGSFILIFLLAKYLPKSTAFSKLILSEAETSDKGFVSYPSEKELVGMEGVALTSLRPAGSAQINGKRVDVVADWDYIEKGKKIKVLRVEGIKVVVEEAKV
jgi:membrane-bound serine protease (ClpP class)